MSAPLADESLDADDDAGQDEMPFDEGNEEEIEQQRHDQDREAQRELDAEIDAEEQEGAIDDGGEEQEEFDDESQLRGLDSQQLADLAAEAAAAAEEDAQAEADAADAAAEDGPFEDGGAADESLEESGDSWTIGTPHIVGDPAYADVDAPAPEQEQEPEDPEELHGIPEPAMQLESDDMRMSQAGLSDGGGGGLDAQDANYGEEEEQAQGDDEQEQEREQEQQPEPEEPEQQEEDEDDEPAELQEAAHTVPLQVAGSDDYDADLDPNLSPLHRSKVSFSAAPRIEIAPEAEYVSTPASMQASPTHAAAALAATTKEAKEEVAAPAAVAPIPDRAAVAPAPVARVSSVVRSSVPALSSRPPLPQSELDSLRHRFLGLRVITSGKIDVRVEGEEGKHWVRAESLPVLSEVNCEKYEPYQRKKICYDFNKHGIIVWIRYNS